MRRAAAAVVAEDELEQSGLRGGADADLVLEFSVDLDRGTADCLAVVSALPERASAFPRPWVEARRVERRRIVAEIFGDLGGALDADDGTSGGLVMLLPAAGSVARDLLAPERQHVSEDLLDDLG